MSKDTSEFLAKVPLFRGLSRHDLERIANRMREREYKAGDNIVEQGAVGIGLFIIVEGSAEVVRTHPDGSRLKLDTVGRYDFFGELSLLEDTPRTASVIALEATHCLALSKLDFLDELESDPVIAIEMLKELAARFRRLVVQL